LCSVLGVFFGPLSTVFAEQFPAQVRSTALALSYNFAVMVFGGFAPFFVTWLIGVTGSPVAPAFYVLFGAAVGLLAAFFLKERAREARLAVTDVAEANVA
jgi:MHS family proline/betaine transporter-like MFS transporter